MNLAVKAPGKVSGESNGDSASLTDSRTVSTSLARSLAVLELFTLNSPAWTADRLIERLGYARSDGELDSGHSAAAAPVFNDDGEIRGSTIAALSMRRPRGIDFDQLATIVVAAGKQISAGIAMPLPAK